MFSTIVKYFVFLLTKFAYVSCCVVLLYMVYF